MSASSGSVITLIYARTNRSTLGLGPDFVKLPGLCFLTGPLNEKAYKLYFESKPTSVSENRFFETLVGFLRPQLLVLLQQLLIQIFRKATVSVF